jgi:hypothetical protein
MAVHPQKVANTAGSLQLRSLTMLSLGSYTKKVLGMGNKFYQRMDHKVYHTK